MSKKIVATNDFKKIINNYSTEEQVIGKWIDGKPLYRKVFTGSISAGINVFTDINKPANFKKLINAYGNYWFTNVNVASIGSDNSAVATSDNFITLYINNSKNRAYNYELVVEYTKTTD